MGENLIDAVKDYVEEIRETFENIYLEYKDPEYSKDELLGRLAEAIREL